MGMTEGPRESDSVGCQRYVRRGYDTNWYTNIPTLPLTLNPCPRPTESPRNECGASSYHP